MLVSNMAVAARLCELDAEIIDGAVAGTLFAYEGFVRSLRNGWSGTRMFFCGRALAGAPAAQPNDAELRCGGADLSPQDRAVLLKMMEGHTNKVIASQFNTTEDAMKAVVQTVLRKIGVENRTQAAVWALANMAELNLSGR
jgi:DNA-binding NarL/FixJ family response regulator